MHLAERIDWDVLNERRGAYYKGSGGEPPKPTGLRAGWMYLKHAHSMSDEGLVERLLGNPYWLAFCCEEFLQHKPPIDPASLKR